MPRRRNPNFGKKHSDESKLKMSAARKGERNPCFGRKGERHPLFGKKGERHPNFGKNYNVIKKKRSDETKLKISAATSYEPV